MLPMSPWKLKEYFFLKENQKSLIILLLMKMKKTKKKIKFHGSENSGKEKVLTRIVNSLWIIFSVPFWLHFHGKLLTGSRKCLSAYRHDDDDDEDLRTMVITWIIVNSLRIIINYYHSLSMLLITFNDSGLNHWDDNFVALVITIKLFTMMMMIYHHNESPIPLKQFKLTFR